MRGGPIVQHPLDLVPPAGPQLQLAQVQPGQGVGLGPLLDPVPEGRRAAAAPAPISPRHTSCCPATRSGCRARWRARSTARSSARRGASTGRPRRAWVQVSVLTREPLVVGGALLARARRPRRRGRRRARRRGPRRRRRSRRGTTGPARAGAGSSPASSSARSRSATMSALPCSSAPSVSRRYAVTRAAPGGSDSTRGPSSSVSRCFSPASWRCRARASTRSTSGVSGGVRRQAWRRGRSPVGSRRARPRGRPPRRAGRELLVGDRGREGEVQRAALLVGDDLGEPAVRARAVRRPPPGAAAAASSGWAGRTRSPSTVTTPAATAALQGRGAGELAQLARPAGPASQREGQQHPAGGLVEVGDPQPEQVLDVVGHGQVVAEGVEVAAGQHPADLEGEQRVAHRRVVDPPQQVVRQAQPEPGRQDLPRRAQADRADGDAASSRSSGNALSTAVRRPGRRASRNVTGSACSRRAAYASASSDALSSHWRSSIATRMRSPSLSARSAESTASEITWASGGRSVGSAR